MEQAYQICDDEQDKEAFDAPQLWQTGILPHFLPNGTKSEENANKALQVSSAATFNASWPCKTLSAPRLDRSNRRAQPNM